MKRTFINNLGFPSTHHFTNRTLIKTGKFSQILLSMLIVSIFSTSYPIYAAASNTSITESKLVVSFSGPTPKGSLTFPLFKGETFQYFSAGVGLEERQLTYPPYPLKLILVQGTRAFLSNVSITARQLDGPLILNIPATHVEGPWVFLNIPTGTYLITATNHQQKSIEKQVSVVQKEAQTVHLRWPNYSESQ